MAGSTTGRRKQGCRCQRSEKGKWKGEVLVRSGLEGGDGNITKSRRLSHWTSSAKITSASRGSSRRKKWVSQRKQARQNRKVLVERKISEVAGVSEGNQWAESRPRSRQSTRYAKIGWSQNGRKLRMLGRVAKEGVDFYTIFPVSVVPLRLRMTCHCQAASEYSHLTPEPFTNGTSTPCIRSTPTLRRAFTHHSGYPVSPK